MSYQVLARKWRPRSFQAMVGQEHILRMLTNALDDQRLHHAYLFTGTRGVGKTTLARIFAKCLNCESGITSKPCDTCATCQAIDAGKFLDLIEVDAASRTKVEDTRELLENVQYTPTQGRFKIYLIDEVHMLSGHSFNALLKTLEEPPTYVKFLLATTDPKRLPITILSRCLQFNLNHVPVEKIAQQLAHVCTMENIKFELPALQLIAQAADGSMRDALSLLDQTIAFCRDNITTADTQCMLGSVEQDALFHLLDALAKQDGKQLLTEITHLSERAPDFNQLLEDLLSTLHKISVTQVIQDAPETNEQIKQFAQCFSAEDIQLYYQIALIGRRDLPLAPTPQQGFEMALLRMLAFRPSTAEPTSLPIIGLKSYPN
jgi:DNA polymerase-3 subunit gamma/tau